MGRDSWGEGVYAPDDGAEYGGSYRQYVVNRGADGGRRYGSLLGDEACGGGSFGEPVPDAAAAKLAGEGLGSVPGVGAHEYPQCRPESAPRVAKRGGAAESGNAGGAGRVQGCSRGEHASGAGDGRGVRGD